MLFLMLTAEGASTAGILCTTWKKLKLYVAQLKSTPAAVFSERPCGWRQVRDERRRQLQTGGRSSASGARQLHAGKDPQLALGSRELPPAWASSHRSSRAPPPRPTASPPSACFSPSDLTRAARLGLRHRHSATPSSLPYQLQRVARGDSSADVLNRSKASCSRL